MDASPDGLLDQPGRDEISIDDVLQAIADPVRLGMLRELAAHPHGMSGAQCTGVACGDIPLTISNSTRTHHLRVLRDAGVISTRTEGTRRMVWIRADDLEERFPGLLDAVLVRADA
jgi:DNA-binding transcriptional ArsR family regulator